MENAITSILAFMSTNIDDIFILMLFYGSRKFKPAIIVIGQYLGIGTLVLIALLGSLVGNFLDPRYVGVLGLFPIYLAIRGFIELTKQNGKEEEVKIETNSTGILSIAGVAIANGADNIGVYVPLFSTMNEREKIGMIVIFGIMTYVWCAFGKFLASRPLIARQIDKFGHVIMPLVLLLLGIFILHESKSLTLVRL